MNLSHRHPSSLRPLALGGALLWGVLELIALWRSRWVSRAQRKA